MSVLCVRVRRSWNSATEHSTAGWYWMAPTCCAAAYHQSISGQSLGLITSRLFSGRWRSCGS